MKRQCHEDETGNIKNDTRKLFSKGDQIYGGEQKSEVVTKIKTITII